MIDPVLRIETGYTGLNARSHGALCRAVCIRGVSVRQDRMVAGPDRLAKCQSEKGLNSNNTYIVTLCDGEPNTPDSGRKLVLTLVLAMRKFVW